MIFFTSSHSATSDYLFLLVQYEDTDLMGKKVELKSRNNLEVVRRLRSGKSTHRGDGVGLCVSVSSRKKTSDYSTTGDQEYIPKPKSVYDTD